ncbi:MAG: hypothetical protein GXP28_11595 [Planctomycetes bacterium]|nr:hypothetical protein [Planctomycetota bacterium]
MSLQNSNHLRRTKEKLRLLEDRCLAIQSSTQSSEHSRQLTLRSLKQLVNQLKEEIARFELKSIS